MDHMAFDSQNKTSVRYIADGSRAIGIINLYSSYHNAQNHGNKMTHALDLFFVNGLVSTTSPPPPLKKGDNNKKKTPKQRLFPIVNLIQILFSV